MSRWRYVVHSKGLESNSCIYIDFDTYVYLKKINLGEISIDWADDEISKNLPIEAPVLGILHTITGSARQNAGFMRYAAKRGWRSCVLNRFVI